MLARFWMTTGTFLILIGTTQAQPVGPKAEDWKKVVGKGVSFLKKNQGDDGSWSGDTSPGITGIALTGMLQSGQVTANDPSVKRGLKYIEGLINPKAGHIAGKDPAVKLQNYVTCINLMALMAADKSSYKAVISDATKFLKKLQWDEGEGKSKEDDFFGGAGYDSKSRPDLSNTQFFIDALREAGVPADDPAMKNVLIFVSRCQNLKSEENNLAWAGKINDGSFIYSAAGGGQTKVPGPHPDGSLPGYGSMTYAGIKSMIYCGVSKKDPRVLKALEWIQNNYTLSRNPGFPKDRGGWGLYYYYHTMAKTLALLEIDHVKDKDGKMHDWRAELTAELMKRQRPDGSWVNETSRWLESDPNIVTGYALMALSYCKPKK